jgi:hypothetical protein
MSPVFNGSYVTYGAGYTQCLLPSAKTLLRVIWVVLLLQDKVLSSVSVTKIRKHFHVLENSWIKDTQNEVSEVRQLCSYHCAWRQYFLIFLVPRAPHQVINFADQLSKLLVPLNKTRRPPLEKHCFKTRNSRTNCCFCTLLFNIATCDNISSQVSITYTLQVWYHFASFSVEVLLVKLTRWAM